MSRVHFKKFDYERVLVYINAFHPIGSYLVSIGPMKMTKMTKSYLQDCITYINLKRRIKINKGIMKKNAYFVTIYFLDTIETAIILYNQSF